MYEFQLQHKVTGENEFIFGYSLEDAWARSSTLKRDEWIVVYSEYID